MLHKFGPALLKSLEYGDDAVFVLFFNQTYRDYLIKIISKIILHYIVLNKIIFLFNNQINNRFVINQLNLRSKESLFLHPYEFDLYRHWKR